MSRIKPHSVGEFYQGIKSISRFQWSIVIGLAFTYSLLGGIWFGGRLAPKDIVPIPTATYMNSRKSTEPSPTAMTPAYTETPVSLDTPVSLFGARSKTLSGHTDHVYSLSFSPNGQTLALGSADKTVKLWKTSDGTLLQTLDRTKQ